VEIVDNIPALLQKVDAVIITSVDGRVHLEQVRPVIAAGKPVFIDKPMAASLAEVKEIFDLANKAGVPCFSASSLRYMRALQAALADTSLGDVVGCHVYSPSEFEPHHPDFFWYGIHGVEMLFTIMGPECLSLSRIHTAGTDVVGGTWRGDRLAVFRGIRAGKGAYGATVFFEKGVRDATLGNGSLYADLLVRVVEFFQTGESPVPQEETVAIFAFMEAADRSKEMGGTVVTLK
jgi:hypothetical protein